MPVYEEKEKTNGQKVYFIRCYVDGPSGKKQITRHNKAKWIGRNGKILAQQEEIRLISKETIESLQNKKKKINLLTLKDIYLKRLEGSIDEDTLRDKETKLSHFCEEDKTKQVKTFPYKDITRITKEDYNAWKKEMKEKKYPKCKNGNSKDIQYSCTYSNKTLNKIHNIISNMFDFAISEGLCSYNVAKQCGPIGTPKEIKLANNKLEYETINFDEFTELLKVSEKDLKYNIYFHLAFTKGPRPGEIRAFRCRDFLPNENKLMVNHTMSKKNNLKAPKTASSKAPIEDLDDELVIKIKKRISELKLIQGFNEDWYILGGEKPISENALNKAKDKYLKLANIDKHIRLHDFRHSCATWMFSLGIPITVISKILRHKDISETLKTYTHLVKDDYIKATKMINEMIKFRKTRSKTRPNDT